MKQFSVLLINPPIYDFAAYDLWSKPLGLLYIAAFLKKNGVRVTLLDCLDRLHPLVLPARSNSWGCGRYFAAEIRKPEALAGVPRRYKRYGLPREEMRTALAETFVPDMVLVTSGMTYWYPGVREVIELAKETFPLTPVVLGGIYATLCREHAISSSGADYVISGDRLSPLCELLGEHGAYLPARIESFSFFPPPAYELYPRLEHAAIRTSRGCPFRCSYCAIELLSPGAWERRNPVTAAEEIEMLYREGVRNIAFYDDALLFAAQDHFIPLLREIRQRDMRLSFHSPNGLHARFLTAEAARLMKETGFVFPRLSLETASVALQRSSGGKVSNEEFIAATRYLNEAGYGPGECIAYLLIGMPGQSLEEVEMSAEFAHRCGARVSLAEYSPLPGSREWESVKFALPSEDPLWHNNSLFPFSPLNEWGRIWNLKRKATELNRCFT